MTPSIPNTESVRGGVIALAVGLFVYGLLWAGSAWFPAAQGLVGSLPVRLLLSASAIGVVVTVRNARKVSALQRECSHQQAELARSQVRIQDLGEIVQRHAAELSAAQEALQTSAHDRQWAERALLEIEKRNRAWMDQASDGIFVADRDGRILDSNQRLCDLLGLEQSEVNRQTIFEHLFGDATAPNQEFLTVLENGDTANSTRALRRPDDTVIHVEIRASVIDGAKVLGIIRDITARKQAEDALQERELWYRTVFEVASDAMFLMDGDEFIDCNAMTLKMFRCQRDQIVGQPPYRFSPPEQPDGMDSRTKAREYIRRTLAGERQFFEWRHSRFDDTVFDAEVSLSSVSLGDKTFILAMVRDVTERRRMEASLRESETRSRAVVETSRDAIVAMDTEGHISVFNPAAEAMFGRSAADIIGASVEAIIPDRYRDGGLEAIRALLESGHTTGLEGPVVELEAQRADGTVFPVEITVAARHDTPSMRVVANIREISDRLEAAEQMREHDEQFRIVTENITDLVAIFNGDVEYIYASPVCKKILGYEPGELVGQHLFDHIHADDTAVLVDALEAIRDQEGEAAYFELRHQHHNGSWRVLETMARRIPDVQGQVRILMSGHDITERKQMQAMRLRLATAIEQTAEAVVISDSDGAIEYVNPAFTVQSGYPAEEVIGTPFSVLQAAEDGSHDEIRETVRRGRAWSGTVTSKRRDGTPYEVQVTVSPIRNPIGEIVSFVAVLKDVTQEKALRAQLDQAQKMEAVGELAGGVAHDFNNILTAIIGYGEFLQMRIEPGQNYRDEIDEILNAAERASTLTRQLLAFSRKQVLQLQDVNISNIVTGLQKMLARLIGEDIQLEVDAAPDVGRVTADPGQLEQVVMNLVVNARDAMPTGGTMWLRTANVDVDEEFAAGHIGLEQGRYAVLSVKDTGVGMPPDVKAQIFEPFFTTKDKGKGTGLGLSTVYGIIKQCGGHIAVESVKNHGTEFTIYLPRVGDADPERDGVTAREKDNEAGTETILLAEDDATIRALAVKVLERHGYRVIAGASAQEAMVKATECLPMIDLLLTDVVMPGASGRDLAEQLTAKRPDLPVLFMSGYNDNVIVHHGVLDPGTNLLAKPFTTEALLNAIRRVLDGHPA